MVSLIKSTTNRVSGLRKLAIVAALLSIAPTARPVPAQDHFYGSSTTSLESSMNWPWWHSIYFQANGSPRYATGFALSTRNTQYRLPINPPISGPSYGYHQPCWKQMAVVRRCVTCETFPANREIPNTNATQAPAPTQIPPAPEASEEDLKGDPSEPNAAEPNAAEPSIPEPSAPEPNDTEPEQ